MERKLHVGVIGAMGRGAWIGRLFNETGKAEVVAVADINPSSFAVGRERYETAGAHPELYTDVATMLQRDDLDWVVIGTPDRTHFELARQVILAGSPAGRTGRNVFVEKPMTQTTAEADGLCRLVAERAVRLVVGYEMRYTPMAVAVRRAIAEGMIGRPVIGTFVEHQGRGYSYYLRDHRKKQWGRGLLMQKGVHSLDLMNYFADADPVRVYGSAGLDFFGRRPEADGRYCRDCAEAAACRFSFQTVQSPTWRKGGPRERGEHAFDHCVFMPDSDAEDNMHLLVDYHSGFRLVYTAVFFATHYSRHEFYLWGTEGSLRGVMNGGASLTFAPISGAHRAEPQELPLGDSHGSHGGGDARFVEAIVQATLEGKAIRADVWDGRAATAVAEFGLKSIESGQPLAIPPRPTLT